MKKLLATILAACMVMSLAACGKEPEPEQSRNEVIRETAVQTTGSQAERGWEGEYRSTDTEEHFKIFNVTDTGFTVEFYHFEEGLLEKFDYEMEFDNAEKTMASEKGTADDNGGWEYAFQFGGDKITVTWQQNSQVYSRAD